MYTTKDIKMLENFKEKVQHTIETVKSEPVAYRKVVDELLISLDKFVNENIWDVFPSLYDSINSWKSEFCIEDYKQMMADIDDGVYEPEDYENPNDFDWAFDELIKEAQTNGGFWVEFRCGHILDNIQIEDLVNMLKEYLKETQKTIDSLK